METIVVPAIGDSFFECHAYIKRILKALGFKVKDLD